MKSNKYILAIALSAISIAAECSTLMKGYPVCGTEFQIKQLKLSDSIMKALMRSGKCTIAPKSIEVEIRRNKPLEGITLVRTKGVEFWTYTEALKR